MTIDIKTFASGTICYYKDGQTHREDGPAVIFTDGGLHWLRHGKYHREDGPAVITGDGTLYWYFEDISYSFDRWCQVANIADELRTLLMLKYDTKSSRPNIDD